MNKRVYSQYLKKEVVLNFIEIESPDSRIRGDVRLSHKSLEDLYLKIKLEKGLEFSAEPVACLCSTSDLRAVFQCRLTDKYGWNDTTIGETSRETLTTDIAKAYPALMAYERGFDTLFKRLLMLQIEGVYTDREIIPTEKSGKEKTDVPDTKKVKEQNSSASAENNKEPAEPLPNVISVEVVDEKSEAISFTNNQIGSDNEAPERKDPAVETKPTLEECENYVINFGKYDEKTLKQIRGFQANWMDFMADKLDSRPEVKKYVLAYREYIQNETEGET